jgi:hypothetical protein
MATCTFDQLLFALRVSVEAANEALRRRRLAHYAAGDAGGDALHVDVPRDAGADAPLESVVLPLRWFRDPRMPQITELSVEFDCRLRYERGSDGATALVVDLHPAPPRRWRRRPLHRLRIGYRAADAWQPSVSLDGRPVAVPLPEVG